MASIGDIYFAFRGDGARLKADAKKAGEAAGDVGGKGFAAKFKGAFSGGNMKQGLMQGLGLGVGLGAIGVATQAVGQLTQVMGDAVQAALAEEKSIAKLGAALKANIPDWDGQTDAIEKVLASRMRLGFADDEQRESLATLVAVTKDATKALDLQRKAMDLARLRNIDLAAASDIVGKVYGGNIGILSRYGIAIKKGATATEALAELTKLAGGQAEAYAETNEGKLLASQVKVGEAMEKLGGRILPFVGDAMGFLADGVSFVIDAFELGIDAVESIIGAFGDFNDTLLDIGQGINDFLTPWDNATTEAVRKADYMADAVKDDGSLIETAFGDVGDAATDMGDDTATASRKALVGFGKFVDSMVADTQSLIADVFDPIQRRQELGALEAEEAAQRRILASKTATDAEKTDAREALTQIERDNLDLRVQMFAAGELNAKEQAKLFADLERRLKTSTGKAKGDVIDLMNQLRKLGAMKVTPKVTVGFAGHAPGTGPLQFASGGVAPAGVPFYAGEVGKELITPMADGSMHVTPSSQTGPTTISSGGDFHLHMEDKLAPKTPRELIHDLRMLGEMGHLTPAFRKGR